MTQDTHAEQLRARNSRRINFAILAATLLAFGIDLWLLTRYSAWQVWFITCMTGAEIIHAYGATETSPGISINTPMHNRQGTVGRLLPGITHRLEAVRTSGA